MSSQEPSQGQNNSQDGPNSNGRPRPRLTIAIPDTLQGTGRHGIQHSVYDRNDRLRAPTPVPSPVGPIEDTSDIQLESALFLELYERHRLSQANSGPGITSKVREPGLGSGGVSGNNTTSSGAGNGGDDGSVGAGGTAGSEGSNDNGTTGTTSTTGTASSGADNDEPTPLYWLPRYRIIRTRNAVETAQNLVDAGCLDDFDHSVTAEENYWPNILHWLIEGQGPKPAVTCAICAVSTVKIPGLYEAGDSDGLEEPHICYCGHVFGITCLEHWVEQCLSTQPASDRIGPLCPICRAPLYVDVEEMENARVYWRNRRRMVAWYRQGRVHRVLSYPNLPPAVRDNIGWAVRWMNLGDD
ncbi:hypothetical protein VTK56DRAFT_8128 [Thermocarpiscus australiensis]